MEEEFRLDCAVDAAMSVIEGKWKAAIICKLARNGHMRFSELMKEIPTVSSKVLTNQLRELEKDDIILRESTATAKRVAYSLTEKGYDLIPALKELVKWSLKNMSFGRVIFDESVLLNVEDLPIKA